MTRLSSIKAAALCGACTILLSAAASARDFNIPSGDLESALDSYTAQTGVALIVSNEAIHGIRTKGVQGDLSADDALTRLLSGTGFTTRRTQAGAVGIVRTQTQSEADVSPLQLAQAAPARASVETVTVTSSKLGGADVQSIPIAITALSQEQLTSTQTAGGPDLIKQVPNLTFTKTNFTGYNIQIRGIGTQAISVTTDPAVAVSFNDVPFIRNHFFEQEFFDVSQVEVLRGPQGTLYGRNATAGVVNLISAKPTDHWEAQASVDVGNYNSRRMEGMLNVPLVGDQLDLRVAGEWTKRDGYAFNDITDKSLDGRNLWSGRVSLLVHPVSNLTGTFVYEHFQEDDNRARSTKQLCARANPPSSVDGPEGPLVPDYLVYFQGGNLGAPWLSQGCRPESLYSPNSYQTPNAGATPFLAPYVVFGTLEPYIPEGKLLNPYSGLTQSHDLRRVSSQYDPTYRAKNDTFELNADYNVTASLKLTSQTAYSTDFLYSTEDFNRFNTQSNFLQDAIQNGGYIGNGTFVGQDNQFCDPQFGCSSRWLAVDRSSETARQFYQELRLVSDFKGNWNFIAGGNYTSYHTVEDYYVFSNLLTLLAMHQGNVVWGNVGGVPGTPGTDAPHIPFDATIANSCNPPPADPAGVAIMENGFFGGIGCQYIDPNPIDKVNGQGHNYFLSHNPYSFNSWAAFGEVYYQITPDVKLTGGLRYTDDKKDFPVFPSWALMGGKGIPQMTEIKQEWREFTGRAVVEWTPKFDFTDQTMVYGSFAHGYKGGGANPPGVTALPTSVPGKYFNSPSNGTHPLTFEPEFNNAFEVGTKNKLGDSSITLNGDMFYYKYKNYQISQIIDRTAININLNSTVMGAEIQSTWSPLPGLTFGLNGGYQNATIDGNQYAIDVMDRTAGHPGWMVVRPFPTQTSNCVLPDYVVNEELARKSLVGLIPFACLIAYTAGFDPISGPYQPYPDTSYWPNYPGFDPLAGNDPSDPYTGQNTYNGVDYGPASNNGEGFAKNVGGNQLPNAPHFTTSLSADYSMPLSSDWAGTLHGDFYWQSGSYWRIFNDSEYDKLHGYTNINLALIFTNQEGWQTMVYVKNLVDNTAISGAFLNSDDTNLTTNVFITDPRLFGIRITKNW
ncbi:MAG TPA: TonB-dependent receptor [Rhizomicrobium sp.]|nr:TonB-dependent receptor [Rhizomicrobium sp.]